VGAPGGRTSSHPHEHFATVLGKKFEDVREAGLVATAGREERTSPGDRIRATIVTSGFTQSTTMTIEMPIRTLSAALSAGLPATVRPVMLRVGMGSHGAIEMSRRPVG